MKIFKDSGRLPERPGSPQGTQRDPKNRPQNVFLLKKGVPNVNFLRFLRAKPLFNLFARFFLFFSRKIDEKSMKKTIHVFTASLVFLNMATLTKHCILRYESYFLIFRICAFFAKKTSKEVSKIQAVLFPSSIPQQSCPGGRFGCQSESELTSQRPKTWKMMAKSRFWTEPFSNISEGCKNPET